MMEKILLYVKHHIRFLWEIIEFVNVKLFTWFYKSKMDLISSDVIVNTPTDLIHFRKLNLTDLPLLHKMINSQKPSDLQYFRPHGFDLLSIEHQLNKSSFLMMGAYDSEKMVGYFFLRFFITKKCFVGRIIDKEYRHKGIGAKMNTIMYEIAWKMGFRCLSTISKNNTLVIRSHAQNEFMIILKELRNDYLLVEFVREADKFK